MKTSPSAVSVWGSIYSFNNLTINKHTSFISNSIFYLYSLALSSFYNAPFLCSFLSIKAITRHAALLAPTTFLNATDKIFLSSEVNSSLFFYVKSSTYFTISIKIQTKVMMKSINLEHFYLFYREK